MAATFLSLSMLAMTAVKASPINAVRADVEGKRGVAFNETVFFDYFDDKPKFSWCYDWGQFAGPQHGLEYVPMLHGNTEEFTRTWDDSLYKAKQSGSKYVFSFNEPDQCGGGGSCIQNYGLAAADHKTMVQDKIKSNGALKGLKIGAPSVTNGPEPKGATYLRNFIGACQGCKFDFFNAHWYASATELPGYDPLNKFITQMTEIHDIDKSVDVWVTEFGFDQGSEGEKMKQLGRILDWMDKQPWIKRYAYHMATPGLLINPNRQGLSGIGNVYATQ